MLTPETGAEKYYEYHDERELDGELVGAIGLEPMTSCV
jgi:nucleoside diphosphate kinase